MLTDKKQADYWGVNFGKSASYASDTITEIELYD